MTPNQAARYLKKNLPEQAKYKIEVLMLSDGYRREEVTVWTDGVDDHVACNEGDLARSAQKAVANYQHADILKRMRSLSLF